MKSTTNNNELIRLEEIQDKRTSLEEKEKMNSKCFIDWMNEYNSNDVLFEER